MEAVLNDDNLVCLTPYIGFRMIGHNVECFLVLSELSVSVRSYGHEH